MGKPEYLRQQHLDKLTKAFEKGEIRFQKDAIACLSPDVPVFQALNLYRYWWKWYVGKFNEKLKEGK